MGKRRTRAELLCEVLESIDSEIKKPSHILYNTMISWTALQEMLGLLQANNCIEKHMIANGSAKSRFNYSLTSEGKNILANLRYLRNTFQITTGD